MSVKRHCVASLLGLWSTLTRSGHDYYGDFFNYSRSKNPEALIMSRPVDTFDNIICTALHMHMHARTHAHLVDIIVLLPDYDFSPKYVMFSGWVGDQDPTFEGLQYVPMDVLLRRCVLRCVVLSYRDALANMFQSAWANYTNFGSDIGLLFLRSHLRDHY